MSRRWNASWDTDRAVYDYRRQLAICSPAGVQSSTGGVRLNAPSTIEVLLKLRVSTETASRRFTRVRWRILLPILMLVLSSFLMVVARKQQPMLRKMGTGWEVPARVINALVNGPGFYVSTLIGILIPVQLPIPGSLNKNLSYDAERLWGILVFWFFIGLAIDRRTSKQSLDQQYPIRAGVLFTFGALVCGVTGVGRITYTFVMPVQRGGFSPSIRFEHGSQWTLE